MLTAEGVLRWEMVAAADGRVDTLPSRSLARVARRSSNDPPDMLLDGPCETWLGRGFDGSPRTAAVDDDAPDAGWEPPVTLDVDCSDGRRRLMAEVDDDSDPFCPVPYVCRGRSEASLSDELDADFAGGRWPLAITDGGIGDTDRADEEAAPGTLRSEDVLALVDWALFGWYACGSRGSVDADGWEMWSGAGRCPN